MKTALVTGGASGIGAAIATRLIADGFFVISADLAPPHGQSGSKHRLNISVDLTLEAARRNLLEVVQSHGRLDVLVNNAGIFARTPIRSSTDDQTAKKLLAVNAFVPRTLIEMLSAILRRSGTGSVINIASVRAFTSSHQAAAYSVSKAMLVDDTQLYARTLGPRVRVNAVAPGDIQTAMTPREPDILRDLVARVALKRLGMPAEVAAVVSFLASPAATSINGQVINVDGGFLCT